MKRVLTVLAMVMGFSAACIAAETNYFESSVERPVYCSNIKVTYVTTAANAVATINADSRRIGGYIHNLSTATALMSGVATTTTTLTANSWHLSAADATGNDDVFSFRVDNAVYQGAVYVSGIADTLTLCVVEYLK